MPYMDTKIDTVAARAKLAPRREPYWRRLAVGRHLGYRFMAADGDGTWVAKYRDDDTGNRRAAEWGLETTFHKSQRNGRLHSTSESGSQHARDVVEQGDQHQTTKKRHSHPLEPLHPGG